MDVDLKSKDGQEKFIEESMSDLLKGINDSYGPLLVEELVGRIDKTIDVFNMDVDKLFKYSFLVYAEKRKRCKEIIKLEKLIDESDGGDNNESIVSPQFIQNYEQKNKKKL